MDRGRRGPVRPGKSGGWRGRCGREIGGGPGGPGVWGPGVLEVRGSGVFREVLGGQEAGRSGV